MHHSQKLLWAEEGFERLNRAVLEWADGKPSFGRKEFDSERGDWVMRAILSPPAPTQIWSLMLGDIVHSLRSALDSLAYSIVRKSEVKLTPAEKRLVEFPIRDTLGAFEKWSERRPFFPAEPLALMKTLQPFARRGDPSSDRLAIIRDLWNADKHRGIVTTVLALNVAALVFPATLVGTDGKIIEKQDLPLGWTVFDNVEEGGVLACWPDGPDAAGVDAERYLKYRAEIWFQHPESKRHFRLFGIRDAIQDVKANVVAPLERFLQQ